MLGLLAFVLILAIFLVIALPGLVALARPRAAILAVPFYLVLLGAFFLHYVGLSFGGRVPAAAEAGAGPSNLCEQAIVQSEAGGLILDRSNPVRVRVGRDLWQQLPQEARNGLIACLEMARPRAERETPVEIVEVGAPR